MSDRALTPNKQPRSAIPPGARRSRSRSAESKLGRCGSEASPSQHPAPLERIPGMGTCLAPATELVTGAILPARASSVVK